MYVSYDLYEEGHAMNLYIPELALLDFEMGIGCWEPTESLWWIPGTESE